MRALVLSLALLCGTAHAGAQQAAQGTAADIATTWAAQGAGATELNPLGLWTVPLRIGIVMHARTLPDGQGTQWIDSITSGSWGAAASNLLTLGGAGALGPLGGLMVAVGIWQSGADERDFYAACARHKAVSPGTEMLPCIYAKG